MVFPDSLNHKGLFKSLPLGDYLFTRWIPSLFPLAAVNFRKREIESGSAIRIPDVGWPRGSRSKLRLLSEHRPFQALPLPLPAHQIRSVNQRLYHNALQRVSKVSALVAHALEEWKLSHPPSHVPTSVLVAGYADDPFFVSAGIGLVARGVPSSQTSNAPNCVNA